MNQKALKSHGPSQVTFTLCKEDIKASRYDLVLHENVMSFHINIVLEGLEEWPWSRLINVTTSLPCGRVEGRSASTFLGPCILCHSSVRVVPSFGV